MSSVWTPERPTVGRASTGPASRVGLQRIGIRRKKSRQPLLLELTVRQSFRTKPAAHPQTRDEQTVGCAVGVSQSAQD